MNIKQAIGKHTTKKSRRPEAYRKYGQSIDNPFGELIFQDNGGSILAVGHLDTVLWGKPKLYPGHIANCPQLDDRLGVAIILELLGEILAEPIDILLCDNEEQCNSTAQYFAAQKQYRWVVEFDRAGSDCVLYQYDNGLLAKSLVTCGIEVGRGSYSDIAELDCLGCECVNWGCGYHDQHTIGCYANYAEVETQLAKFATWYRNYGHLSYPYVVKPKAKFVSKVVKGYSLQKANSVRSEYNPRNVECIACGCRVNWIFDFRCIDCGGPL